MPAICGLRGPTDVADGKGSPGAPSWCGRRSRWRRPGGGYAIRFPENRGRGRRVGTRQHVAQRLPGRGASCMRHPRRRRAGRRPRHRPAACPRVFEARERSHEPLALKASDDHDVAVDALPGQAPEIRGASVGRRVAGSGQSVSSVAMRADGHEAPTPGPLRDEARARSASGMPGAIASSVAVMASADSFPRRRYSRVRPGQQRAEIRQGRH